MTFTENSTTLAATVTLNESSSVAVSLSDPDAFERPYQIKDSLSRVYRVRGSANPVLYTRNVTAGTAIARKRDTPLIPFDGLDCALPSGSAMVECPWVQLYLPSFGNYVGDAPQSGYWTEAEPEIIAEMTDSPDGSGLIEISAVVPAGTYTVIPYKKLLAQYISPSISAQDIRNGIVCTLGAYGRQISSVPVYGGSFIWGRTFLTDGAGGVYFERTGIGVGGTSGGHYYQSMTSSTIEDECSFSGDVRLVLELGVVYPNDVTEGNEPEFAIVLGGSGADGMLTDDNSLDPLTDFPTKYPWMAITVMPDSRGYSPAASAGNTRYRRSKAPKIRKDRVSYPTLETVEDPMLNDYSLNGE